MRTVAVDYRLAWGPAITKSSLSPVDTASSGTDVALFKTTRENLAGIVN